MSNLTVSNQTALRRDARLAASLTTDEWHQLARAISQRQIARLLAHLSIHQLVPTAGFATHPWPHPFTGHEHCSSPTTTDCRPPANHAWPNIECPCGSCSARYLRNDLPPLGA